MKSKLIIILFFICNSVFAQQNAVSAFVSIPSVANQIKNLNNVNDLDRIYQAFQKDFPEEKFEQVHFLLDQVHVAAADKLLLWNNNDEAIKVILKIQNPQERNRMMKSLPTTSWQTKSVDSLAKVFSLNIAKSEAKLYQQYFTYAEILNYTGRYQESLLFLENHGEIESLILKHPYLFIELYRKNNKPLLALPILSEIIKSGKGNVSSRELLHEIWNEAYGSDKGFEAYYQEQLAFIRKEKENGIRDRMLSYKAPDFELMDLNGNTVSLKDLHGKVVFLDFWATWCGPCLASFPTMQRVLDKYKSNKDVVFLFVNTMEKSMDGNQRKEKIVQILKKNKLNFQVLLDQQVNGKYDLVNRFKVSGIPAQFVIDKKGQVRFALKGFDGSSDGLIQEIDLLVEETLKF